MLECSLEEEEKNKIEKTRSKKRQSFLKGLKQGTIVVTNSTVFINSDLSGQ